MKPGHGRLSIGIGYGGRAEHLERRAAKAVRVPADCSLNSDAAPVPGTPPAVASRAAGKEPMRSAMTSAAVRCFVTGTEEVII